MSEDATPRQLYRVATQTRTGYENAIMHDVVLSFHDTGRILWSNTFSDEEQARAYVAELEADLDHLEVDEFRRKYGVSTQA
ncbi:MAG: hypothetical protein R3249_07450 [Nitriliruptorales bacterium]|nr:hypothetical protein [Nitriliruptorales bacterium]